MLKYSVDLPNLQILHKLYVRIKKKEIELMEDCVLSETTKFRLCALQQTKNPLGYCLRILAWTPEILPSVISLSSTFTKWQWTIFKNAEQLFS